MFRLRVLIMIPDPGLRRSVEFMIHAQSPEAELVEAGRPPPASLIIVDETALSSLPADHVGPVVVLSEQSRPASVPPHWQWLEKSHLGASLQHAIDLALRGHP